jgi:hypothetical protein
MNFLDQIMLEHTCQALMELIFVIRPGPHDSGIDDLYQLQEDMDSKLATFQKTQADGRWKKLNIMFMRNETCKQ